MKTSKKHIKLLRKNLVKVFNPSSGVALCFGLLETAVYWRADKNLGCMDHNPFGLVERTFSIFQLLLF